MRLATLRDGTADGRLVILSADGKSCRPGTAGTLQRALDTGDFSASGAEMPFDETACLSPLPRAYQFLDGSAYVNHVELVRKARGAVLPDSFWTDPLMYQGSSDSFLAPRDPIPGDPAWGIDMEAEVAVITGAVPQGASPARAAAAIRLVLLLNDISLRNLIPAELAKGFGFVHGKPPSALSPIAVTPDELPGWRDGKLHGALKVDLNGRPFGRADAGVDMTFDFPTLIAHAARTRPLAAGTIIGSGTVSNKEADGPGRPISDGGLGYSCIAELRMVETIQKGRPETPFMAPGDRVTIWMEDAGGRAIFGTIDQTVG
ncbi:fumarylacetoacetate hydrolase family protein [Frigidibacter sp. ROC022]|uniref:fumarylacetoacetate hydrolase family protein n=1 Tax=Frigidibacter sp. ROC022 TaxID=2971796 RepID=UPI00215A53BE|nr:fumarylacetoacetate hydrolase family protein [Frigidibacter sp. ROC022]MCR8724779.1 fumarylacetoacetate hydrolase family protein [Frigidibacter sp. ROC022]